MQMHDADTGKKETATHTKLRVGAVFLSNPRECARACLIIDVTYT